MRILAIARAITQIAIIIAFSYGLTALLLAILTRLTQ